jgi:hypothetical protein
MSRQGAKTLREGISYFKMVTIKNLSVLASLRETVKCLAKAQRR